MALHKKATLDRLQQLFDTDVRLTKKIAMRLKTINSQMHMMSKSDHVAVIQSIRAQLDYLKESPQYPQHLWVVKMLLNDSMFSQCLSATYDVQVRINTYFNPNRLNQWGYSERARRKRASTISIRA